VIVVGTAAWGRREERKEKRKGRFLPTAKIFLNFQFSIFFFGLYKRKAM
jgi:hypothetical protein